MEKKIGKSSKVQSLDQRRRARQVLQAFDKIEHEQKRATEEKRAEVERSARKKF